MSVSDEYNLLMNEEEEETRKIEKPSKLLKFILVSVSLILIILSANFTTEKLLDNEKILFTSKKYRFKGKSFPVNNFKPLYKNGIKGPITIDREKDNGKKVNIYKNILNLSDNEFESFYFDEKTFQQLNETIPADEKYMCETDGRLTEDMTQGHDLRCPMFYHITLDKRFYGRYSHDDKHCITDYKGDKISKDIIDKFSNLKFRCGREIPEYIDEVCNGKNSCILQPGKNLPDTCSGYGKYLHIQYHCTRDLEIKKPRIAIVMFANNIKPNSIYENAISELYQYADFHGYKFIFSDNRYDDGRDLFYMKLHVVSEAIADGLKNDEYDWIFWVDSDVVLANPNIKLEAFLPVDKNIHFIAASDENGLNAGVFFIRVHSWSLNFMIRAIAYRFTDKKLKLEFADQTSMSNILINDKEEQHYTIVPQHWFNIYLKNMDSGDFLIHFAGLEEKDQKANLIREEIYKGTEWSRAQTNKQLRNKVLEYYKLPKEKQGKIWFHE